MANRQHQEAQRLASLGEIALTSGEESRARELYAAAAEAEQSAFDRTPSDRKRTRSILAVSATSLLYKAQKHDDSELAIFRFLGRGDLNPWAQEQLRELLEVVADERFLLSSLNQRYAGESVTVSLRGGMIGSGTGPLDLVLKKIASVKSLLYRFAEWVGEYPLRVRGAPPAELQDLIQARVAEPAVGSYRMEIRLTEPSQIELFESPRVSAADVGIAAFEFLERLNRGSRADIEDYVPDERYRKAFLDLSNAIAPDGKKVNEVGLYHSQSEKVTSIYLTGALKRKIRQVRSPLPTGSHQERHSLEGVLRALHLDKNWLEITDESGEHVKCDTLPDMLDDVVGPMVNNMVIVSGPLRTRYGQERLLVEDIDLTDT